MADTYFGKYRAEVTQVYDNKVIDNRGLENRGRIRVKCPKVLGNDESNWCEPCLNYAWDFNGDFVLPEKGDTVWVEFEEGNPNKPIWVGNWFKKNKTPIHNPNSRNEEPNPNAPAKSLESTGSYKAHHDKVRTIQFGKYWIVIHRDPDYIRVYDAESHGDMEFFSDHECVWLKRKKGTMTFYSNDSKTYLERTSGKMQLLTDDSQTYLRRDDSDLIMVDNDTQLFKSGSNIKLERSKITVTTDNIEFNIAKDFIINAKDMTTNLSGSMTETVIKDITTLTSTGNVNVTASIGNVSNSAPKGSVTDKDSTGVHH